MLTAQNHFFLIIICVMLSSLISLFPPKCYPPNRFMKCHVSPSDGHPGNKFAFATSWPAVATSCTKQTGSATSLALVSKSTSATMSEIVTFQMVIINPGTQEWVSPFLKHFQVLYHENAIHPSSALGVLVALQLSTGDAAPTLVFETLKLVLWRRSSWELLRVISNPRLLLHTSHLPFLEWHH